ncbi:MAG: hypothetical protein NUV80_02570 [Candidatus Berkelbacteria bacterium]|nr:hypothetical protein [Candidatus Berkelbacteria bacterium]
MIGFSNGISKALIISATDKLELKQHFRTLGRRQAYVYKCFAAIIFLLIGSEKNLDLVIIDTEYPGQEPLIKNHLLNFLKSEGNEAIDKHSIIFKKIGKASNAHKVVNDVFKGLTKVKPIMARQILDLLN